MKTFGTGLPAACRAFRADLVRHLEAGAGARPDHDCADCRRLLANAQRVAEVLRATPRPELPAELREPAFLERVHQRTLDASSAAVGPTLREALRVTAAPAEVDWAGRLGPSEDRLLRDGLRPGKASRAPDWLWARIRADVVGQRDAGRRRRRFRFAAGGLAAAALVTATLLLFRATGDGTRPQVEIVFRSVSTPPSGADGAATPLEVLRRIGRSDW